MTKPILECNGIAAGYVKGLNILQGVDLVVNEGEIVSIIGPNGAGKSTLLKAIMSLIKVSAGRFFVNGEEKEIELDQENALLSTALKHMGYKPNTIVVELNNLIINSMKWEKVKLKDGDNLEIVSIVGGG